ncbi:endonuclease/exonuclease/phosphatase family protein [Streptomyces niveus]|uniref:endonuclease/exonuclease/phosphatase family protein n=1 Tax=Streptomyces niveus TaxID=193462 RepID=UPI0036F0DAC6
MSQNAQYGADKDGRWKGMVDVIRDVGPDLLALQEVDWLRHWWKRRKAERALGMRIVVAPSRQLNVAVAWNPKALRHLDTDTRYSKTDMHHGHCAPRFQPLALERELPKPLVFASTHLTPYSVEAAAQEAQLLCARLYRYGGLGLGVGDINHVPLGDDEPDWTKVQAHNWASRCLRRRTAADPWRGHRLVGEVLRDGDLTDVCSHVAQRMGDFSLRQLTGKAGLIRTDQAHVTPALVPAIQNNYRRIDPGPHTDHWGIAFSLDLDSVDTSLAPDYA